MGEATQGFKDNVTMTGLPVQPCSQNFFLAQDVTYVPLLRNIGELLPKPWQWKVETQTYDKARGIW